MPENFKELKQNWIPIRRRDEGEGTNKADDGFLGINYEYFV
jgi:hypothetical protein